MVQLRRKTAVRKESDIQSSILDWLKLNHYVHWRNYVGPILHGSGRRSPNPMAGLPDILGILKNRPGTLFAIEVKKPKGNISPLQIQWMDNLNKAGVVGFFADDVLTVIRKINEAEFTHENNRVETS